MTLFSEREYFRNYAAPAPAPAPTATSYTEAAPSSSSSSSSSSPTTALSLDEKRRASAEAALPNSIFDPSPFVLGYIPDYNALPEYLRKDYGYDANSGEQIPTGDLPFATIWGQQLGLDNNYNYAIMPDGSVQQLYWGGDPTYDPGNSEVWGATDRSHAMTAQQLIDQYGWDYNNAPRDAHGYAMPGMLGDLNFSPSMNPGIHHQTGLDMILGDVLPKVAFSIASNWIAGPVATGALMGGMAADDANKNPFAGAAAGALTAGAADYFAPIATEYGVPNYVVPAVAQAGTGMLTGQAPGDALKSGALNIGIGAGAEASAPYVNSALDSFSPDVKFAADPAFDPKKLGMISSTATPELTPLQADLQGVPTSSPIPGATTSPISDVLAPSLAQALPSTTNYLTGTGVQSDAGKSTGYSTAPDATALQPSGMLAPSTVDPDTKGQQPRVSADTLERIGKLGAGLANLFGGHGAKEHGAPQREEGQSDAAYSQQLAQYANLDAQALADKGLTPGTPEYYDYVMGQMDDIIGHLTEGLDLNGDPADIAAQLRGKTREELDTLERVLYVRGQMEQLMGSGQYADPFTGITEDVIVPGGGQVNPHVAAYQRGLARSADEMQHMSPQEARRFAGGMLSRNPDLFGMQQAADQRQQDEIYSMLNDEELKRRRGMFAGM